MRPTGPRLNERIRITPVRLIDENGEVVGVVETDEARQRARDLGLDLVEMAADSRPPVCRIMDYGRYKYEQSKKDKANKARTKVSELKEVRLGRSMKIDPHDIAIRLRQARKFLLEGHKVQIVQNFRGREMSMRGRGNERMAKIIEDLDDVGKIEAYKRKLAKEEAAAMALKEAAEMPKEESPAEAKVEETKAATDE